jgi:hypothetical protein
LIASLKYRRYLIKNRGINFTANINDEAFRLSGEYFDRSKKLKAKIQEP